MNFFRQGEMPLQAALASLGQLAIKAETMEPLLRDAANILSRSLEADLVEILETASDGSTLRARAAVGICDELAGASLPADASSHAGFALQSRATVVSTDLAQEQRFQDRFLAAHRASCGVAVVIAGCHRPYGVLAVHWRAARRIRRTEVHFLEMASHTLAATLARHQAESKVLERERQARAVFDNSLDALLIADDGGCCVDANPAACDLLGIARPALLGLNVPELLFMGSEGSEAEVRSTWQTFRNAGRQTGDIDFLPPDRIQRTLEYAAVASILPGRHLVMLRDVTERKQMHSRLALADRLLSVGTLSAGLAHELNNPLAYIAANAAFLGETLGELSAQRDPERTQEMVKDMSESVCELRDGADRMRSIIRDLKTFSRPDEARIGPIELAPILESCIHATWNEIRHRAQLVKDIGPVPRVLASEARLGQVFLNLLINAAQSIPDGDAAHHQIRVATRTLPDGRAAVEIRDTGCGIPPENLRRVFDPFFTTKPIGLGTGLGLSVCHGIVAALQGQIEVESELGHGSLFRVVLPTAAEPEDRLPLPAPVASEPLRRARILVVDDEPFVGASIRRALGREHEVVVVSSARQALEMVRGGAVFDVLLSDLLMPDMSGMDLYRELWQTDPELASRTLFLTGGAFTPAARSFLEQEQVVCLEKPFEVLALREAVRRRMSDTSIM
jgi:PAS domain S-box-containing protein